MQDSTVEAHFQSSTSIEAVVRFGADGLPRAWRTRGSTDVDEITAMASELIKAAIALDLASPRGDARIDVLTEHGTLRIEGLDDGSYLLALDRNRTD